MLKYLAAAFFVIFSLTVYVVVQDERAAQHHAQQSAQLNKSAIAAKTNEDHSQNNVYNPEEDTPRWYGLFRWPSGITTWAIIFTLAAIVEQTHYTGKAAGATKDAAEATLRQTDHLVATERPFLMVKALGDATSMHFMAENKGKSPAKIIFIDRFFRCELLPIAESLAPIPNYGQPYENSLAGAELVNAEWLAPGQDAYAGGFQVKSHYENFPEDLEAIRNSSKLLWLYGAIRYKGLTGEKVYESRFCYRLGNNSWHMLGPPRYNDYT